MSVHLVVKNSLPASASPYRLLDDRGSEVAWANQFLDAQKVRQLSLRSLRALSSIASATRTTIVCRTSKTFLFRLTISLCPEIVGSLKTRSHLPRSGCVRAATQSSVQGCAHRLIELSELIMAGMFVLLCRSFHDRWSAWCVIATLFRFRSSKYQSRH